MSETSQSPFTAEEQAYFDNKGGEAEAPAVAVEQQQPEAQEGASEAEQPEGQRRRDTVPHGALHEERERRKSIERERDVLREERRILEERTNILLRGRQEDQPAKTAVPNVSEDPIGFIEHIGKAVQQSEEQRQQQERQRTEAQQQAQAIHGLLQESGRSVQEFKTEAPDVEDAMAHLRDNYVAERRMFGLPDDQIAQEIAQYDAQITAWAKQNGKRPAEVFYDLAKRRGYQKKAPAVDDVTKRLDTIERGQTASRTLGASGGGPSGSGLITAEDLLKMSADEFEAFAKKSPKKYKELMGG